jgi:hypothetical protein
MVSLRNWSSVLGAVAYGAFSRILWGGGEKKATALTMVPRSYPRPRTDKFYTNRQVLRAGRR